MYSGIKERMNKLNKLSEEEKVDLKKLCKMHHASIREYMEKTEDIPFAVRNALEDRMIELSNIIL